MGKADGTLDIGKERCGKVFMCDCVREGELGAAMVEEEWDEIVLSESLAVASSAA
jgi:hypothetical protein